jgi:hypothetical protein
VSGWQALICSILLGFGLTLAVAATPAGDNSQIYYVANDGLACSGCHGIAGEGGGEGGISIPPLAGRVGAKGLYRSQSTFCNLLATGQLKDRRVLSNLMPRYIMAPAQCEALYRFTASLSEPVFTTGENAFAIDVIADPRSQGQLGWKKQITDRLMRANDGGGIHGRNFAVGAGNSPAVLMIDFTRSSAFADSTMPTVLLQAEGKSPMMKAIESSVFDETKAVVATYPGERVLIIDPLEKGPKLTALRAVLEQGTELLSASDCPNTTIDHIVILSLGTDASFGLEALKSCKGSKTVAISLRNVRAEAIASIAQLGLLPPAIFVFTPVPTGEPFTKIPETIAEIIIDMARRMGANPDRTTQIQAFDQAWRAQSRGDAALFSGASLVEINPSNMSARGEPVWYDSQ